MQVTAEFKRTAIGLVPLDWTVSALSELCDVRDGTHESPNFYADGVPFVTSKNIVNGKIDLENVSYIRKEDAVEFNKRSKVDQGDILMSMIGTIGMAALVDTIPDFCIKNVALLKPQKISPDYLMQLLDSPPFQKYLAESLDGGIQKFISLGTLRSLEIPFPNFTEQRAIATALSDVDALIAGLEKLIAKKRDLKQATMQQLLTGQTRLPGFSGEWVVKALGDITNIKTGSRNNEDKVEDGLYPFFVRSAHVERINSYSHECEAILIPGEGQIGDIFHYINGRFDVHQRVYAITQFIEGVSGQYIHLYMSQHFGEWAMQNTVKATVDSLRLPTFQTFRVQLPPTLEEQTSIAEALSAMDSELLVIESRLTKIRELKQGMMQELLTGRTRLV